MVIGQAEFHPNQGTASALVLALDTSFHHKILIAVFPDCLQLTRDYTMVSTNLQTA
jgi:hypothetical protein